MSMVMCIKYIYYVTKIVILSYTNGRIVQLVGTGLD